MTSKTARLRAQRRAEEQAAAATQPTLPEEGGPLYARYRVTLDFDVRLDPVTDAEVEAARAEQAAQFPGLAGQPWEWDAQQILRAIVRDQAAALPVVTREIASTLGEEGAFDWPSWLGTDAEIEDAIARLPIPEESREWLMMHRRYTHPDGDPIDSQWLTCGTDHLRAELVDAQIVGYSPWHRHDEQEEAAADDD